ncbi:MAG: hypothetical protein JWL65_444 [Gammaproteobacteria bacterium]|nr:hypothetical protein [Gammaproteobacteria bacterium]
MALLGATHPALDGTTTVVVVDQYRPPARQNGVSGCDAQRTRCAVGQERLRLSPRSMVLRGVLSAPCIWCWLQGECVSPGSVRNRATDKDCVCAPKRKRVRHGGRELDARSGHAGHIVEVAFWVRYIQIDSRRNRLSLEREYRRHELEFGPACSRCGSSARHVPDLAQPACPPCA